VRLQFLVEAVGLSLFGATLGQVIGVVAVTTLGIFTPIPARVPLTPFMLVSALAILLGMIVGWLPARYAYRLSPIDALGRER
jgi:ABC-type antimicrobial peptide transport system permease subunit